MSHKSVLVTGGAGFIGFHLAKYLHARGDQVVCYDNFNDYYTPKLKRDRAANLAALGIEVKEGDICDTPRLQQLMATHKVTHVAHLAAQAGVRYSVTHPQAYVKANLEGFVSILECCRAYPGVNLVYASSSSVYGLNQKIPFSINDPTDQPTSLYGATKKANEAIAHSYHHLYRIPVTGLRFFTVYGPWGRPDMAYFSFTKAIMEDKPIEVFNNGDMQRDFTYIDDIVKGTAAAIDLSAPCAVFNLGNHKPVQLNHLIETIERAVGKKATRINKPMQLGDVHATWADIEESEKRLGFSPKVSIEEGIPQFVEWYKEWRIHTSNSR